MPTQPDSASRFLKDIIDADITKVERALVFTGLLQTSGFPTGVVGTHLRINAGFNRKDWSSLVNALRCPPGNSHYWPLLLAIPKETIIHVPVAKKARTDEKQQYLERTIVLTDHGLEFLVSGIGLLGKKNNKNTEHRNWQAVTKHWVPLQLQNQLDPSLYRPCHQPLSTYEIMDRLLMWYQPGPAFKDVIKYMYANPGFCTLEALWKVAKGPDYDFQNSTDTCDNKLSTKITHIAEQKLGTQLKERQFRLKVECFALDDLDKLPREYGNARTNFRSRLTQLREKKEGTTTTKQKGKARKDENAPKRMPMEVKIPNKHCLKSDLHDLCGLGNVVVEKYPFPVGGDPFQAMILAHQVLFGSLCKRDTIWLETRKKEYWKRTGQAANEQTLETVLMYGLEKLHVHYQACTSTLEDILCGNAAKNKTNYVILLDLECDVDGSKVSRTVLWAPFLPFPSGYSYKGGVMFPVARGLALHVRHQTKVDDEEWAKKWADHFGAKDDEAKNNITLKNAYYLYMDPPMVPTDFYKREEGFHIPLKTSQELVEALQQYGLGNLDAEIFKKITRPEPPPAPEGYDGGNDTDPQEDNEVDTNLLQWNEDPTEPFPVLCIGHRALKNTISQKERETWFSAHMSPKLALEELTDIEAKDIKGKTRLHHVVCGKVNEKYHADLYLVGVSFLKAYDDDNVRYLTNYSVTKARKTRWFLWAPNKLSPTEVGGGGILFPDCDGAATKVDISILPDVAEGDKTDHRTIKELITRLVHPWTSHNRPSSWIERRIQVEAIYGLSPKEQTNSV